MRENLKLGPSARKYDRAKVMEKIESRWPRRLVFQKMHYVNMKRPVVLKCKVCDHWFRQRPDSLIKGTEPMCKCGTSLVDDWDLPDDWDG